MHAKTRTVPGAKLISPGGFVTGCYQFTLQLSQPVNLPEYKGDVLHRALGKALAQISPRTGKYFFRPQPPPDWSSPGQTPPKPFLILPPQDAKTRYRKGDTLEFGITLFGSANQYLTLVFAALEKLGHDTGLHHDHGRYIIQRLRQITPTGAQTLFNGQQPPTPPNPVTGAQIFTTTPNTSQSITIDIHTRLRLKSHGKLVRNQLPLPTLTDRLAGRINTLAAMYCGGLLLPPEEKTALITLARTACIQQDNTRWRDWDRNEHIKFGGLTGSITYGNVPAVLLPWLSLGQWIGVGGKTSFGLGVYSLTCDEEGLT